MVKNGIKIINFAPAMVLNEFYGFKFVKFIEKSAKSGPIKDLSNFESVFTLMGHTVYTMVWFCAKVSSMINRSCDLSTTKKALQKGE